MEANTAASVPVRDEWMIMFPDDILMCRGVREIDRDDFKYLRPLVQFFLMTLYLTLLGCDENFN